MNDPGSRYHGQPTAEYTPAGGRRRTIRYLLRRFLPKPDALTTIAEHAVTEGDRLDAVSARYLGDPLAWWRIADANLDMQPERLTDEAGRRVRIGMEKP